MGPMNYSQGRLINIQLFLANCFLAILAGQVLGNLI